MSRIIDIKENLKNKKILILGFGREGKSSYSFLRKMFPDKTLAISDSNKEAVKGLKKDNKLKLCLGEKYLDYINEYDVIFKSPGIPNKISKIKNAVSKGVFITSQTEIFLKLFKNQIIGITGTKGKSTTSYLTYQLFKLDKKNVVLVGNIGKPVLDCVHKINKNTIIIFEMSSHQLKNLKVSPHIAVFLNIYPEHLDYYDDFDDYLNSKRNIYRFQNKNDRIIYNNEFEKEIFKGYKPISNKISFSITNKNADIFVDKDFIKAKIADKRVSVNTSDYKLLGIHNVLNLEAALACYIIAGGEIKNLKMFIKKLKPLENRYQLVKVVNGVVFIDDSLSTIPQTTIAALNAYQGKIGSLILGGLNRGGISYCELAKKIVEDKIESVVLFPESGKKIWEEIKKYAQGGNLPKHLFTMSMKEAVDFCYKQTGKNMICLLSSASPSFTVFRDYRDKADQFAKYVNMLEK